MIKKEADKLIEWGRLNSFRGDITLTYAQFRNHINSLVDTSVNACYEQEQGEELVYTKLLEQKLKDIECGECTKNMLECRCDEECK